LICDFFSVDLFPEYNVMFNVSDMFKQKIQSKNLAQTAPFEELEQGVSVPIVRSCA